MNEIINILTIPGAIAGLIILNRFGILDKLLPKRNGNGKLEADIKEIKENHIHEIKDTLAEIRDSLKEIRDYARDTYNILIKK